jgi:hypothetical protein
MVPVEAMMFKKRQLFNMWPVYFIRLFLKQGKARFSLIK